MRFDKQLIIFLFVDYKSQCFWEVSKSHFKMFQKLVFFAIFALICAQAPPPSVDNLFSTSWDMQRRLSPRQQMVDYEITHLRESLTDVLEVRTTSAFEEVENNTRQVIELERPYRVILTSLPENSCTLNLLSQLSLQTDFSGFRSALCVRTYDQTSDVIVQEAQEFIAMYEGIFVRLQKVVVESYTRYNAFSEQTEIVDRFNTEYNRRIADWEAVRPQAEDFEVNLNNSLEDTHATLEGCMQNVRDTTVDRYEAIIAQIDACN